MTSERHKTGSQMAEYSSTDASTKGISHEIRATASSTEARLTEGHSTENPSTESALTEGPTTESAEAGGTPSEVAESESTPIEAPQTDGPSTESRWTGAEGQRTAATLTSKLLQRVVERCGSKKFILSSGPPYESANSRIAFDRIMMSCPESASLSEVHYSEHKGIGCHLVVLPGVLKRVEQLCPDRIMHFRNSI